MADSTLINPVVSTEAIGKTEQFHSHSAIEDNHVDSFEAAADFGWTYTARKLKQDVLTSLPLLTADLAGLAACLYLGAVLSMLFTGLPIPMGIYKHMLAMSVAYVFIGTQMNLFPAAGISPVFELRQQVTSGFLAFMSLLASNGVFGVVATNEIFAISIAFPLSAVLMPIGRYAARYFCAEMTWWGQPVIIVGASKPGVAIHDYFTQAAPRGVHPIGLVDESPHHYWAEKTRQDPPRFLGTINELPSLCRKHNVSTVIVVVSDRNTEESRRILSECSGIPSLIVLSNRLFLPSLWIGSCDFAGLSGVCIKDQLLSPLALLLKRTLDISVSLIMLIMASPFLLLVAAILKYKSPGPIFYGHPRTGRGGQRFKAWKIRTMVPNAAEALEELLLSDPDAKQEWAATHKLKNDPRIVPGLISFLRKTSLDELPQLWNVLVGDMSLVGPRPLPDDEIDEYAMLPMYYRVRPGMTGLWQVSGRNNTSYNDKVQLDTYYIRNWSQWLDYYILLRTIKTIVLREGAY
jgi:Undecaprenyl-phosphate galactose phosphotransferase WbaP